MSEIIARDDYAKVRAMLEFLVLIMIENTVKSLSFKTATSDGRKWEMVCTLSAVGSVDFVSAPNPSVAVVAPDSPRIAFFAIFYLSASVMLVALSLLWYFWGSYG